MEVCGYGNGLVEPKNVEAFFPGDVVSVVEGGGGPLGGWLGLLGREVCDRNILLTKLPTSLDVLGVELAETMQCLLNGRR